jgi:hypothetical protein
MVCISKAFSPVHWELKNHAIKFDDLMFARRLDTRPAPIGKDMASC